MAGLSALAGRWFKKTAPIQIPDAGLFHFERRTEAGKSRVHLRLDASGALLLVNANRAFRLNPAAARMAWLALSEVPEAAAIQALSSDFEVAPAQAADDYRQLRADLLRLVDPDPACPICDLDLELTAPFSAQPSAPYRMDLALTYRCNNACAHCYNDRPRNYPELDTEAWLRILDRLWEQGIPHIVFTGGEPTLRSDLPRLIAHAEKNGQITGINTNGRRLKDPAYLQSLIDAGLDHVQITFESHEPAIHDHMVLAPGAWQDTLAGLQAALKTRLYVMTNTTLLQENSRQLAATLDFLAAAGVPTVGLNALIYSGRGATVGAGLPEADLPPLLDLAAQKTSAAGQRLIWYTPTCYCHFDPVQMDLGVKGCTAARFNMCVEPDGAVLPCQSFYTPIGNLLRDDWDAIWNHELALELRERRNLPDECHTCALVQECGGGCPLARRANPDLQIHPVAA